MTDEAVRSIRASVLGADRGLRVIDGGGGASPPAPPAFGDAPECPVTALGHLGGVFHLLDVRGQKRELSSRQLGSRHDLLSLFGGDDAWLRAAFPKRINTNAKNETEPPVWQTVDFRVNDACAGLQRLCFNAGLFGDHVLLRKPGVWRDPDGEPAVHCGDMVWLRGEWLPAGQRTGAQVWAAAAPTPRPGTPCGADVGRHIQDGLRDLWKWADEGGPVAMMGLIANAYYGAATEWRPAGFITGPTGGGKTSLLKVVRGAIPLHHHDNDTSKAGIEQAVNGRAMAIIIDEAADRADRDGARNLIDLVLSATSDEGTKGTRGTVDGRGRRIEVAGLIMMFSINAPELEPQHLGRFTMVDLRAADEGADHRAQHRELAAYARAHGPALWARALAGWDRYAAALEAFRAGLKERKCAPREMDQAGALLAGWWLLTREGVPDRRAVAEGVGALGGFVRVAAAVASDDRPRRMMQHLLATMVTLHRSTDREPVGKLLGKAFGDWEETTSPDDAAELLSYYGVRVVRRCLDADKPPSLAKCECLQCTDHRRRPVPRLSREAGVWFAVTHPALGKLFEGTPFDGGRWRQEMARIEGAKKSGKTIRIGRGKDGFTGEAIWLPRQLLSPDDDDDENTGQ